MSTWRHGGRRHDPGAADECGAATARTARLSTGALRRHRRRLSSSGRALLRASHSARLERSPPGRMRIAAAFTLCVLSIPWILVWGSKQLFLASLFVCAVILLRLRLDSRIAFGSLCVIAAAIYAFELHPPHLPVPRAAHWVRTLQTSSCRWNGAITLRRAARATRSGLRSNSRRGLRCSPRLGLRRAVHFDLRPHLNPSPKVRVKSRVLAGVATCSNGLKWRSLLRRS